MGKRSTRRSRHHPRKHVPPPPGKSDLAGPPPSHEQKPLKNRVLRISTGYPGAIVLVIVYWVMAVTSVTQKSLTCDELVHIPAGYTYWKYNDYRMNPENGNLPQRWMGIPLVFSRINFPSMDQYNWIHSEEWKIGQEFFYDSENDFMSIAWKARAMIAVVGMMLGLMIYTWSRALFGPVGGIISLAIFVFDPSMLAHGRLATSDITAAMFFTLSLGTLWRLLQKITPLRLLASCLAMAGMFLAKMSAVLLIPIGLILIAIRLVRGGTLPVTFPKLRQIAKRSHQIPVFAGIIVIHAVVVLLFMWASFGFRYSMFAPGCGENNAPRHSWESLTKDGGPVVASLVFAKDHKLVPEAYLFGFGHVYKFSRKRSAFFMGQHGIYGWKSFFPFAFLVKTPLWIHLIVVLAAVITLLRHRREQTGSSSSASPGMLRGFYATAPLWILLGVYWLFSIFSHLNIGHRHILPTYPPLYILAGASAYWFRAKIKWPRAVVLALLGALAVESLWIYPHYLAYFNQLVGGPKHGYKYFVDSSLDWGQDLPHLKRWLDENVKEGENVYLSYFGNNFVPSYGIDAKGLSGVPAWGRRTVETNPRGGIYCVSATMVQTVLIRPWGPWQIQYEQMYQNMRKNLPKLLAAARDPEARKQIAKEHGEFFFEQRMFIFDQLQFARLAAYLRQREPDDFVGYSILIYRLSDAEAHRAIHGPPPELKPTPVISKGE